jgi:hypothetical protein
VAVISQADLHSRLKYFVVRTERGASLVRRDPRELPRRLRVLLLAIDGGQTVELYVNTLNGFGDISELLIELLALGLIELKPPGEMYNAPRHSEEYSVLNELLDDSRFDSQSTADMLYGATVPGSFDDMLRTAQLESPGLELPIARPPAPVSPEAQKAQIESLFDLLEKVRGERRGLRHKLGKMEKMRVRGLQLEKNNRRLKATVFILATVCIALLVTLALVLAKR